MIKLMLVALVLFGGCTHSKLGAKCGTKCTATLLDGGTVECHCDCEREEDVSETENPIK